MLRMERHYRHLAPGVFQMENRFFRGLLPKFFEFKKFFNSDKVKTHGES